MNEIEELVRLKTLLDKGAITVDEFNLLKGKIIGKSLKQQLSDTSADATAFSPEKTSTSAATVQKDNNQKPSDKAAIVESTAAEASAYEQGTEMTSNIAKLALGVILLLVVVVWVRYESFILAIILGAILFGALYLNGEFTKKVKRRNLNIGLAILVSFLIIIIPIGKKSDSSSSNEKSTVAPVDDDAKFVRDYITTHYYEDTENGYTFTLKFSDHNAGWFGIMEFNLGPCVAFYRYETKGRSISLTYDSSTCPNVQGSSSTARFNSDNSISLYYRGEEFRFKPV